MAGYSRPAVARIFGVSPRRSTIRWDIGATVGALTQLQSAEHSGVSWSGAVAGCPSCRVWTSRRRRGCFDRCYDSRIADDGRRRERILAALLGRGAAGGRLRERDSGLAVACSCSSVE